MSIKNIKLTWNNIAIDVTYNNDWSKAHCEIMGHAIGHLEIRSKDKIRLPITETGYRSHFTAASNIEDNGGLESYVREWLDAAAQSKEWKRYVKDSKQLSLF